MLIINNRFLSLYDYNFLLVNQGLEKIFSVKPKTKQQRASAVLGASLMKSSNQLGILFFIKMKKKMERDGRGYLIGLP
jgi:hypothetical protein